MRLIDELLKDDFFHGGYQPAETPVAIVAEASGKKPIVLIAGIAAGVLLLGGGGAAFYLMKDKSADSAQPTQTAAVVPPSPPAAAVAAPVTTASAAITTPASVTSETAAVPEAAAPEAVADAPAPEAVPVPEAAPPAPAAPPKPVEPKYRLVLPKLSDRAAVDKLLAELKRGGVKATTKEGAEKSLVFEVVSDPAPSGAANALKIKASLFKIDASVVDQGGGQFIVTFGKYRTKSDAQKVIDALAKFSAKAGIQQTTVSVPTFEVRVTGLTKETAEEQVGRLSAAGYDASMERQK